MSGKALLNGLKRYVTWLVITAIFPLLWLRSLRLAGRHSKDDSRARAKVVVAIGISLVIALGGFRYQEALTASTVTIPEQINNIRGNIAKAEANGTDTTELQAGLSEAQEKLATEQQNVT